MLIKIIGTVICLFLCSLLFWLTPISISFSGDVTMVIVPVLSYLFAISLFIERSIEVFLSAWRSTEADAQDMAIVRLTKKIDEGKTRLKNLATSDQTRSTIEGTVESQESELIPLEAARTAYRAKSRIIALWTGLALGTLIAAVGIRILIHFVDADSLAKADAVQLQLFNLVDVLITGSLLAGGSSAINQLMKIYDNFSQATAEKAKGEPKPQP
jgi:hypothetical protein